MTLAFISYAQNFEDVMLWRALKDVENGQYVDIGAQDPTVDSVSRAFHELGWHGVHVEPHRHYANELRQQRPGDKVIEAVVASAGGTVKFYEFEDGGLSTASSEVADFHHLENGYVPVELTVPSITLDDVLQEAYGDVVHWLKIDVEGFEAEVLKGWINSEKRPWVIIVESTFPTTDRPTQQDWESLILAKEYSFVYFDGLNRFYLHEHHRDLEERFRKPPNVFDAFQLSGTATSMTSHIVAQNEQKNRELERESERLRRSVAEISELQRLAEQKNGQAAIERSEVVADVFRQAVALNKREQGQRLTEERERRRQVEEKLEVSAQQLVALREAFQMVRAVAREEAKAALSSQLTAAEVRAADLLAFNRRLEQLNERSHLECLRLRTEADDILRTGGSIEIELKYQIGELTERVAGLQGQLAGAVAMAEQLGMERDLATQEARAQRAEALLRSEDALARRKEASAIAADLDQRDRNLAAICHLSNRLLADEEPWILRASRRIVGMKANVKRKALLADFSAWLEHVKSEVVLAPTAITSPAQSLSPITYCWPGTRALSLAELCALYDSDFVACAYLTILGREADPPGEQYYTSMVRAGAAKLAIIDALRSSPEGTKHDPGIAGLDRALHRHRRANAPLIGPIFRAFTGAEGNSVAERQLRAIANQMYIVAAQCVSSASAPATRLTDIAGKMDWVADHLYESMAAVLDRTDLIISAVGQSDKLHRQSPPESDVDDKIRVSENKIMIRKDVLVRLSRAQRIAAELLS